ncbi:cache domain-containing sensor histidine kinase [Facklamia miroungae]|uniref:Two-component system, sensor histidine kinase YesM n=1 Tax=Facklamia miroungae TaxID=120956 RepID=A0A1G7T9Y4_9LACT|nr:sensor histidine kinase [Facklamia miroungae]NKZ29706.1 sensor histidine kinase [Facklamia miroungae]SDG31439.1 two-component system, sensor histidine kinase YesM [Facklamia miroungae]
MKTMRNRFDRKISVYFFSISMMIVLILSYANYRSSVKIIKQNIEMENSQQLKTASLYIASYLEKMKSLNSLLAMTPELNSNKERVIDERALKSTLDLIKSSDTIIKNIMVITKSGQLITHTGSVMESKKPVLNEEWYQTALKSNNMAQITRENHSGFTMNKSERVISLSHKIEDGNREFQGLTIIDVSYKFIEDYISTVNLGENGFAFIVDENKQLIFDSEQMNGDSLKEKAEYLAIIEDSSDFNKEDYIISTIYVPNTNWQLTQVRSPEEIYTLNRKLITEMLIWAFLILLLSIFLSIFVSKKVTNPIVDLIDEMKKVNQNFSNIPVNQQASLEIIELTLEYNLLLDRVKKLTETIEEKEKAKRTYELKALQSQINPHFIYNTLDTILWLVELGEKDQAVEVIQSLGSLLRTTLSVDEDVIELKREIEQVKNYLNIQKIRYDDKFDYDISLGANTGEILVPKLIIQPIVENAIYHGIKTKKGQSHIQITASIGAEALMIQVEDNGVGFKDKKHSNKSKPKLGGIGMANVDQRLKILYGDAYGLTYTSDDQLTRVTLKIKI